MGKMTFEDVAIIWAAKEFKIPRHEIKKVNFELENRVSWIDTFGNEDRVSYVQVGIYYKDGRRIKYQEIPDLDFNQILEGLVKVASGEIK